MRGRFARIICLLLAAALLLPASGCASVFDKEYFSATDYEYARPTAGSDGAIPVTSYTTLRLAISSLVTRHDESGTLDLSGYSGENISDDLASACNSVSRETALGSYAVDYISYEVNTIVGYTEAQIYVYYKRSQEEIDSIVNVATAAGLYTSIAGAVQAMSPGLVVLVSVTDVDEDEAESYVTEAYMDSPLACVVEPTASVDVYSGLGMQRIYDVRISYPTGGGDLEQMHGELNEAASRLAALITAEGDAYRALQCARLLTENCRSSETEGGGTAYDALVRSSADCEGMALAYKALCDTLGIGCVVVEGRLDRAEHYWNIITVDGASYHVDTSRAAEQGFASTFLRSDAEMWGGYWWDIEEYPECAGPLSYAALTGQGASPSPGAEDAPGTENTPGAEASPAPVTPSGAPEAE